jgi:hypothetical protein
MRLALGVQFPSDRPSELRSCGAEPPSAPAQQLEQTAGSLVVHDRGPRPTPVTAPLHRPRKSSNSTLVVRHLIGRVGNLVEGATHGPPVTRQPELPHIRPGQLQMTAIALGSMLR